MHWSSSSHSHPGKRRLHNEDAVLARPDAGLWLVADGLGGHRNGALASRLIVDTLAALELNNNHEQNQRRVRQALNQINRRLSTDLTRLAGQPTSPMGSTVVTLLIKARRATCIWAGDSRCYLWRQNQLHLLTRDHSLAQRLINTGKLSADSAAKHPSAHVLFRAVGAHEQLRLDSTSFAIQPGDVLLLCSDGLYRELSPAQLIEGLRQPSSTNRAALLVSSALRGTAADNISAVVVTVMSEQPNGY
ncbi:MAG: PP2C family serine/threonine-protein phosphatase [Pseudomonadaceae bacterium]